MSKQLKLQFKKILKKAEFVHADLEYHEELSVEAKKLFAEAIKEVLNGLSAEDREKIRAIDEEQTRRLEARLREQMEKSKEARELEDEREDKEPEVGPTDLVTTDTEYEEDIQDVSEKMKVLELKKIFHKIAELTHPDKVTARGAGSDEVSRLEKIFKRALDAYHTKNCYVLYSTALELDVDLDDPTIDYIDWVEDDIRATMAQIACISNLLAWVWYTGSADLKIATLADYFSQSYGVNLERNY